MENQRNLIIAIVLSVLIVGGYEYWLSTRPQPPAPPPSTTAQNQTPAQPAAIPPAGGSTAAAPTSVASQGAPAETPRLPIDTPNLKGTLSLRGARFDDLILPKYLETTDADSPPVRLLDPTAGVGAYFADFGWVPDAAGTKVPDRDTIWKASGDKLTPSSPVTLTWDNGAGLVFTRLISVDSDYMFTIEDKVQNSTAAAVNLHPYGLVDRWGTPLTTDYAVLHEGPIEVMNGALKDTEKYSSLKSDKLVAEAGQGGWIGFTDKYWLTALVPDQKLAVDTRMSYRVEDGTDRFQTDWTGPSLAAPAGGALDQTQHFFAGAKELDVLERYENTVGVPKFNLAIDFGYLAFLTIPLFKFLTWVFGWVHNYGLTIIIFTLIVRGAFFPIANTSFRMMNKMRLLQPEVKKLQERFGDDKAKLSQETMALYRREKANPAMGCLPVLLQVPVFFALYKVLFINIEMRHQPFIGWIKDLSVPDPTNILQLFGLIHWTPPAQLGFLEIGLWPLIMGVTLFFQQKFNPPPADPTQARLFQFMPVLFTFMLGRFPAGLVIYWSWSNTLSITQQWVIRRRMAAEMARKTPKTA